jgi:hypothetical protein
LRRRQLPTGRNPPVEKRTGQDGKVRRLPQAKTKVDDGGSV